MGEEVICEDSNTHYRTFEEIYDEIANEMSASIPGYVAPGVDVVTFRKRLWSKYRINKNHFQAILQQLKNDPYFDKKINLYGGPIYLKGDWVECNGRHWLLIEVRTEDHERQMAPHRS